MTLETDKHSATVRFVAWNGQGDRLVTAGDDKKVKVWHHGKGGWAASCTLCVINLHV